MTRVLAQYVSLETAALALVELVLSFLIIDIMLSVSAGALDTVGPALQGDLTQTAAVLAVTTAGIAATIGLYRPDICLEPRGVVVNAVVSGLVAFPVVLAVGGYLVGLTEPLVVQLGVLLVTCQTGILVTHLSFSAIARRFGMVRRVLILGSDRRTARLVQLLRDRHRALFEPVPGIVDVALLSEASLRGSRIWGVVLDDNDTVGDRRSAAEILLDSKMRGVRVLSAAAFCEQHLGRIDPDAIDTNWLLRADGFRQSRLAAAVKRTLDVAVSLVLLVLTLPVMLLTALLIKLESPGPVFYRQQRIGLYGQPFTLIKFRSMTVDAETEGSPRWAQQKDPRVTTVGSFIRPMRIDELPQLLNVLVGQMSLIGPRPERPHFVEQLARIIPFYRERAYVKPGVTGWAQVNYPYGASVEDAREKLAYDLYYVKNWNLLVDLLILLSTVRVVLFREGAR